MPVLRVMKNGKHLCTVGSDDVWSFSASVWGEIWGPEVSFLNVSGGSKRRIDGESDFLIWEMPHELTKLDRITFNFEDGTVSAPKGAKFDPETYPPEEAKIEMSFPPTEEDIARLEARPHLNGELSWSFSVNGDQSINVAPDVTQQHVGLHLLWNEDRPERLRVSLSKKSLREIVGRSGGEELFLEHVSLGSNIEIGVGI
jgi:hypothetical protein